MISRTSLNRLLTVGLSLFLLLTQGGCDSKEFMVPDKMLQSLSIIRVAPPGTTKFVDQFIESLRAGRVSDALTQIEPSLRNERSMASLQKLSEKFNGGARMDQIYLVVDYTVRPHAASGGKEIEFRYEPHLSTGWFKGHVTVVVNGTAMAVTSAYFESLPGPPPWTPSFSLKDKGDSHHVFLWLYGLNVVFILVTAVVCLFSAIRMKILWFIFILFGITTFTMNWTTGETVFEPMSFDLFGIDLDMTPSPLNWLLSISLPVGAFLFYFARSRGPYRGSSSTPRSIRSSNR